MAPACVAVLGVAEEEGGGGGGAFTTVTFATCAHLQMITTLSHVGQSRGWVWEPHADELVLGLKNQYLTYDTMR